MARKSLVPLEVRAGVDDASIQVGGVWDGSYTGFQQLPIGTTYPAAGSAVLMGSLADPTALYLIGRSQVIIRPSGDYTKQWTFSTAWAQAGTPLFLPADPTEPMHAATKQYVDAHVPEGGGGSGFTFVQDTAPVPEAVGDTWFNSSDGPLGGTSSVAIDRGDGVLIWVQFSPGGGGGGGGSSVEPPIGSITEFINVIPPDRWLVLEGQTLVGGQHTHPALWDAIPETMKVGEDIVFPDTRGRGSMGLDPLNPLFDAVGKVGGSTEGVAPHVHTASSGYVSADHGHNMDFLSNTFSQSHTHQLNINSGNISADHTHGIGMDAQGYHGHNWGHGTMFYYDNAGSLQFQPSVGYGIIHAQWLHDGSHGHNGWSGTMSAHHWHNVAGGTGWADHNHQHQVAGGTGGITVNHVHAVTVDSAGAAGGNLQPYIVFPKIIRVL